MLLICKKSLLDVNIDSNKLYSNVGKAKRENIDESHISSLKDLTNRTFAKAEKGSIRGMLNILKLLNEEGTIERGF